MPKALLVKSHDKNSAKCNFKYVHLKQYDLGQGVRVKLKKETASFSKEAGWGLVALTHIPKGFTLGYFVVKNREADEPEKETYNIKTHTGKFIVMEQLSLMNRINTIPYKKYRYLCNCKISNMKKGEVSIKTTKKIAKGQMLWAKYNDRHHYWEIQYYILQKRLRIVPSPDDNDNRCRTCKKCLKLYLCDSCQVSVCEDCLTQREKFLMGREYWFCSGCLDQPPKYMNRFRSI